MSLTEEQLNNLKPGDPIIIHSTFERMASGGEIVGYTDTVDGRGKIVADYRHIHRSCVSLPPEKPKYDPCRLLRKGDRVQVKKRNGRCNGKDGEYLREAFCEVADDEVPNELVRVYHNSSEYRLDPAYLELVTPVEELEPYSVHESEVIDCFDIIRENLCVMTFPYGSKEAGYYHDKPAAKEAAEAECERLNTEWRNKQKL